MNKEKYIILEDWDRFGLMEDVNKEINNGYMPYGDLIFKSPKEMGLNHSNYTQVMILKDDEQIKEVL